MSVDYHRHCQATVLGATGDPFGNGKTWHKITQLEDQLTQLDENWLSNFTNNVDVTEDLAGILRLIDNVAGKVNALGNVGYTLKFKNNQEIVLDQKELVKGGVTEFVLGRDITLKVGGRNYTFNTMKKGTDEPEIVNIDIPTQSTPGDLIDIKSSGRVDVRNDISYEYTGPVSIKNTDGQRQLTSTDFRVNNIYSGQADAITVAEIVIDGKTYPIIIPNGGSVPTEFTVKFYDYNRELLRTQTVENGGSATAPEIDQVINDSYFLGWDKDFTNVRQNLDVYSIYFNRYVVTEPNEEGIHECDIVLSGYGDDDVLLEYVEK